MVNQLALDIAQVKGIGEKSTLALRKAGINTVFEALLRVPKAVVQELECPGLAFLESGRVYNARAQVAAVRITGSFAKKRLEAVVEDETGRMSVVFFGPAVAYAQKLIQNGAELIFTGEAKNFLGRMQMVHPKISKASNDQEESKTTHSSNYAQVAGLRSDSYKRLILNCLNKLQGDAPNEHLADDFLAKNRLEKLIPAILSAHDPKLLSKWDNKKNEPSLRRLAFEEITAYFLHFFKNHRIKKLKKAQALVMAELKNLSKNMFSFELTKAQKRVILEALGDLSQEKAMSRLIQGDVGCGKTAVSAVLCRHLIEQGFQCALMAPTEILAEQLFINYQKFFKTLEQAENIAFLSSSTKTKERRELLAKLASGQIKILVGTHALITDDVVFKKLGLLVIDEQHRFGVEQRAAIGERFFAQQGFYPHLLVMSATPIPRSLALTMYGDLDLSVIDERPPGRTPIVTKILTGDPLKSLSKLCERLVATNQKAFIVFPLVQESEHLDLEDATKASLHLKNRFGDKTVGLLHGKMKAEEKLSTMTAFKNNQLRFLVSTTVVEVGVDIPDATCMAIINAERFGLSQLHQLRGRVGRGNLASYCFLLSDIKTKASTAYQRLSAMCKTDDGFKLAKIDLDLRGPGELMGTKQAGTHNFIIFNYTDFGTLVEPAKTLAKKLAQKEASLATAHLYTQQNPHFS